MSGAAGDASTGAAGSIASSVAKNRSSAQDETSSMLGKQPNFGPVHYHNNSGGVVQGTSTDAMLIDPSGGSNMIRQVSDQVFGQ